MAEEKDFEQLKGRIARQGEEALGKLAQELMDSSVFRGAVTKAFSARERASSLQEAAMGAFNIPSAADIERLTRRLRSVTHRLEGIEDALDRVDDRLKGMNEKARQTAPKATSTPATAKTTRPATTAKTTRPVNAAKTTRTSASKSATVKATVKRAAAKPKPATPKVDK